MPLEQYPRCHCQDTRAFYRGVAHRTLTVPAFMRPLLTDLVSESMPDKAELATQFDALLVRSCFRACLACGVCALQVLPPG